MGVTQERVIDYCAMIRKELLELCDAAKTKMWGRVALGVDVPLSGVQSDSKS